MTTADMLARLAALQALETCTSANDYETDCAIRRTIEAVEEWKAEAVRIRAVAEKLSTSDDLETILESMNSGLRLSRAVYDFDPGERRP